VPGMSDVFRSEHLY